MTTLIQSRFDDTPDMPQFNVSNHLIDDRAALDAAWERDGYWFFRGVLDPEALAALRTICLEVLDELGVIEPGHTDAAIYNGAPLEGYPIVMGGDPDEDPLLARYPRDAFVNHPNVKALFEKLFGDEVFWVPNTEFHAVPPRPGHNASRFNYVHQDGSNNKGLPLRICWIPIAPISEESGGLAVTEGLHKPRLGDFARPPAGINPDDVPEQAWRRATYEPGDLLMFSLESPHSGLANQSEKHFRLSMDIRGMRRSDNVPAVGTVAAIDRNAVAIQTVDGEQQIFRLDEDTFARVYRGRQSGMPLVLEEIPEMIPVGSSVYVASNHGTATFIRPQH